MRASAAPSATVEQALQQFLQQEDAYVLQLARIKSGFARKLRFQCAAPPSSSSPVAALHRVEITRFVDALAQLHHLHRVYHAQLHALTASGARSDVNVEAKLVDIMESMLAVVRYQYGQLFCSAGATQALLETIRSDSASSVSLADAKSAAVLSNYLAREGIAVEELVMRPLHRFHAIVEFVEALSSLCQNSKLVPRLLQLAITTRDCIHTVQTESRGEQELIALQSRIVPNSIGVKLDLSSEKLLLHGESQVVTLRDAADVVSLAHAAKLYAHCLSSGKLLYSKRNAAAAANESAGSFAPEGCLELKHDPVFFECVPDAVLQKDAGVNGALVLLSSQESVLLGFEDSAIAQQWSATTKHLLSQNEIRTHVLRSQRSFEDIRIPHQVTKQLRHKTKRDSLVSFPFFHDDDLPGIFWLETESRSSGRTWELVELMFYDDWLLISKVLGWKHLTLLHHLDCSRNTAINIREEPSGENDWGLVLAVSSSVGGAAAQELKLVSKRRSRIDFWFDQISKVVAKSTQAELVDSEIQPEIMKSGSGRAKSRAAEQEQPFVNARAKRNKSAASAVAASEAGDAGSTKTSDSMASEETSAAKKTTKKRKASERDPKAQTSEAATMTPVAQTRTKAEKSGAESSKRKKVRSKIDSLVQVPENALEHNDEVDKPATTSDEPKKSATKRVGDLATLQSPAIKTPKRRWLKLKTEDPDDSILLDTDVSQDTTADETTSNDARASQSQNAKCTIRIILTGIEPTPAIRKKIKAVGPNAVYEDDIEKATHVIAPKNQLKRTVKLLCGISRCDHILDEKWLNDSARAGAPLSEQDYCLLDSTAQEKWHFDLHKTMYEFTPEQRRQLFVGHTVFITNHKSVLPPVKDLVKIVECAGGKAEVKGSAGPSDLVITSEAALGVASVQKSLVQANPQRIYSPELILSSILQQHIDFEKNHLELQGMSSSASSRNRRSG